MHIPAKVDYAMRALLELAIRDQPTSAESLAEAQELPTKFLSAILNDLRRAGLISSRRGLDGGYRLARPAREISVADVMRAIDGPLAEVRGLRPEMTKYEGAATHLQDVWIATRASLRTVLEPITLDHIAKGHLPKPAAKFLSDPTAWLPRARTP
ncbi:MAG TPA: Rrf2 family transcriptional regulator [Acidimicrobiales bacterium]